MQFVTLQMVLHGVDAVAAHMLAPGRPSHVGSLGHSSRLWCTWSCMIFQHSVQHWRCSCCWTWGSFCAYSVSGLQQALLGRGCESLPCLGMWSLWQWSGFIKLGSGSLHWQTCGWSVCLLSPGRCLVWLEMWASIGGSMCTFKRCSWSTRSKLTVHFHTNPWSRTLSCSHIDTQVTLQTNPVSQQHRTCCVHVLLTQRTADISSACPTCWGGAAEPCCMISVSLDIHIACFV